LCLGIAHPVAVVAEVDKLGRELRFARVSVFEVSRGLSTTPSRVLPLQTPLFLIAKPGAEGKRDP